MLSPATTTIIKEITPLVALHAEAITARFYELMFEGNPEVRAFFNSAHQRDGTQAKALADLVCVYFSRIDTLDELGPAIEVLAQKHCALQVQPLHYPIVGRHLIAAIEEVLAGVATEAMIAAIEEAYDYLARICIEREKEIYAAQNAVEGGWNGYRNFVVSRKVPESDVVTSFYLQPQDGGKLPDFQPGQFTTLRIEALREAASPRNYSLSNRPGLDHFRISVKKEDGHSGFPPGVVSSYLHEKIGPGDVIELGPPCGEFTIDIDTMDERPVAFLAGGIGVTPLLSMAKTMVHYGVLSPIYFLHAVRNSSVQPFADEIQQMVSDKDFVETRFIYDAPSEEDLLRRRADHVGTLDTKLIQEWTPCEQARYFVCGPTQFMHDVLTALSEIGVEDTRIHSEFFGPKQPIGGALAAT